MLLLSVMMIGWIFCDVVYGLGVDSVMMSFVFGMCWNVWNVLVVLSVCVFFSMCVVCVNLCVVCLMKVMSLLLLMVWVMDMRVFF